MSRLDEVEAEIANLDDSYSARTYTDGYADLARTLAAEVDAVRAKLADWEVAAQQGHPSPCTLGTLCPYCEIDRLRGKLDDVRMGIGCARGQRSTQYCADLTQRDEVITKLLAMLKPGKPPCDCITEIGPRCSCMNQGDAANVEAWWTTMCHYRRACDIAGRTE